LAVLQIVCALNVHMLSFGRLLHRQRHIRRRLATHQLRSIDGTRRFG
jgi:hypothetical protein